MDETEHRKTLLELWRLKAGYLWAVGQWFLEINAFASRPARKFLELAEAVGIKD